MGGVSGVFTQMSIANGESDTDANEGIAQATKPSKLEGTTQLTVAYATVEARKKNEDAMRDAFRSDFASQIGVNKSQVTVAFTKNDDRPDTVAKWTIQAPFGGGVSGGGNARPPTKQRNVAVSVSIAFEWAQANEAALSAAFVSDFSASVGVDPSSVQV